MSQLGLFTGSAEPRSAVFSPCRRYRYTLWRLWDEALPYLQVVGLNPSTADEIADDPTVRRCIGFAARWGYGALCMTNLFGFRATEPRDMRAEPEPVGPENDVHLRAIAEGAGMVLAAWGFHGGYRDRDRGALPLLGTVMALGLTGGGFPRHPLYVRGDTQPIRYLGRPHV
jgi:hypothetical protein